MAEQLQDPARHPVNRTWIMLILLLVAAGIALLVIERRVVPPVPPIEAPQGEPDFFMEGARISQFGPAGSLQYRLAAREIRHFEAEGVTHMLEPQLTLHHEDDPPWLVSARLGTILRAEIGDTAEQIELRDDVVLEHTLRDGERVSLTTRTLRLYPDRQYAETDQDVTIATQVGRTTATGLKGDFRLGTIILLSTGDEPVHTILEPEHFR